MKSLFSVIFVILASMALVVQPLDLGEAIKIAKDRVDSRSLEQHRFSRKKATRLSRQMSLRNEIVREALRVIGEAENVDQNKALEMIKEAMDRNHDGGGDGGSDGGKRDRKKIGRPGGFDGQSSGVFSFNDVCDEVSINCNFASVYRTIDGTCNNEQNNLWGSTGISLRRYLSPQYHDGVGEPRGGDGSNSNTKGRRKRSILNRGGGGGGGGDGGSGDNCPSNTQPTLPNARYVSVKFHPDNDHNASEATHMVAQFGQFLDHDITLTPEEDLHDCCTNPTQTNCFPINILSGDNFYSSVSQTCLEFTRSVAFCENITSIREQMNGITAFIDGSNIYGSDHDTMTLLRSFSGGKLLSTILNGQELLPNINGEYLSGDVRTLEMPGLATMHTLFLREHNRIASGLSGTDDEDLFQRARRIVIAEMQNIVYTEYLPMVLGSGGMDKYNLDIPADGFTNYNDNTNPGITNSFATAAYRFGHSMIQGMIQMINEVTQEVSVFRLRENYFNLDNYFLNDTGLGPERLLLGLINQQSQDMDRFVTQEATNHLFPAANAAFGSDLVARNIQRGRDHGLPGYNDWREECNLGRVCSWHDKPSNIKRKNWDKLKLLYHHPNDIDLFVAGLAESPANGGLTGKTFNCIKGKQFRDLMRGDRYFYSHSGQAGSFTSDQLREIRPRTLADVICDNTAGISETRSNVFNLSSSNRLCSNRNVIDLSLF